MPITIKRGEKLTQEKLRAEVRAFEASSRPREKVFDSQGEGLFLFLRKRCKPYWIFQWAFKADSGKFKKSTKQLGSFPEMTLQEARTSARAHWAEHKDRRTSIHAPAILHREHKAPAITFREWFKTWLSDPKYSGHFQGSRRRKIISFGENYLVAGRKLPVHVRALGSIPVRQITHNQIQAIIDVPIANRSIDAAKLLSIAIKSIFAEACAAGVTDVNIAQNIAVVRRGRFKDRRKCPRVRIGDKEDLARFLIALDQLPPSIEKHALQIMCHVGLRPCGEFLGGLWSEIKTAKIGEKEHPAWIVARNRFKKGNDERDRRLDLIVPLSNQVLALLGTHKEYLEAIGQSSSRLLFPSKLKPGKPIDAGTVRNLCKALTENKQTLHGFRGVFETFLKEDLVAHPREGLPAWKIVEESIALQLDHVRQTPEAIQNYDQTKYLDTRFKLMQIFSDLLSSLRKL